MELVQGVAATITLPAHEGDPVVLAGTVNVVATRQSTGVKIEGTATKSGSTWSFTFTGAQLPSPDVLSVTWKDGTSTYTQQHEVVGGFICSLAAIEKKLGEGEPADADMAAAREQASRDIESACGVCFRPRYFNEQLRGKATTARLLLPRRELLSIVSVSIEGAALTPTEVTALGVDPLGVIVRPAGAVWPMQEITVGYIAGYRDFPPAVPPVRDYAAYLMTSRPSDWMERATGITTDMGSYSLVTAGERGNEFPLPSVNAFVQRFQVPLVG